MKQRRSIVAAGVVAHALVVDEASRRGVARDRMLLDWAEQGLFVGSGAELLGIGVERLLIFGLAKSVADA